jgi:adenylyl- and sulfurtransferase ThiI
MLILVHYGEIGLKGKNRRAFEEKLLSNVKKALGERCKSARIEQKRIFVEVAGGKGGKGKKTDGEAGGVGMGEGEIAELLGKVSGIEWFAFAHECKPDLESVWKCVKEAGGLERIRGKTFGVRTKRSDKDFPLKSMELSAEIGGRIVEAAGARVDLRNPEVAVNIEIIKGPRPPSNIREKKGIKIAKGGGSGGLGTSGSNSPQRGEPSNCRELCSREETEGFSEGGGAPPPRFGGKALVFFGKVRGMGGLPVGSAGKVLCLMSGGIDSPVAAQLMMKRGCLVDYLHVHPFESGENGERGKEMGGACGGKEKVEKSKIGKLIKILDSFQQREAKLFAVSYSGFYARTGEVERRYELVVFRRYLYKLAERVAEEYGYLGIVSGDSLGQVASQTLENMGCAQSGLEVPVFRPLVCMDKMEIVSLAQRIGTYAESVKEYVDCCSLVSVKSPVTKARRDTVEGYYAEMGIAELIEENLGELEGKRPRGREKENAHKKAK